MSVEESRLKAIEVMDDSFGSGKDIAHSVIQTDPVAKAIYDCAIRALMAYDLALSAVMSEVNAVSLPIPESPLTRKIYTRKAPLS
jgi:hypothetical protein